MLHRFPVFSRGAQRIQRFDVCVPESAATCTVFEGLCFWRADKRALMSPILYSNDLRLSGKYSRKTNGSFVSSALVSNCVYGLSGNGTSASFGEKKALFGALSTCFYTRTSISAAAMSVCDLLHRYTRGPFCLGCHIQCDLAF